MIRLRTSRRIKTSVRVAAAGVFGAWLAAGAAWGGSEPASSLLSNFADLEAPEHRYWERELEDPFTAFLEDLEGGRADLETGGGEKEFLGSLLRALDIPPSSQMLLFSKTSLQLSLIWPRNPRAIYFSDEISVGYIPGGRIEIVSIDPHAGGIFYIFDVPRRGERPRVERSNRCMNCHAATETRDVPGLVLKSVIPGPNGGSLDAFRIGEVGHHIPLEDRFGGYFVNGADAIRHKGNVVGEFVRGEIETEDVPFEGSFDADRYLVPTSDVLPQLVFEHQAGFVNRTVEAAYLTRAALARSDGPIRREDEAALDACADGLVRYILFADEAPLPRGGIEGDSAFREAFLEKRIPSSDGLALHDFDLRDRLFRFRCSYMIYSPVFQQLPKEMKNRIYQKLGAALRADAPSEFSYLSISEKNAIRTILRETL